MTDQPSSSIGELFVADAQRRRDRAEGIPRVGGILGTDYVKAYFTAARLLVEATANARPDMAVPCAYLQRHALELACKCTIEWAQLILAGNKAIADTERTGEPNKIQLPASPRGHELSELAKEMSGALEEIGFDSPRAMLSRLSDFLCTASAVRFRC